MSHDAHGQDHDHPEHLAHHFDTMEQQVESGKLGMWIFLATELLMFGGLFVAYAVYRAHHFEIFDYGHYLLDTRLGAINTAVLLASSLTMAIAVRASQLGQKPLLVAMLVLTFMGGVGFMVIKSIEYTDKFAKDLYPGIWNAYYDYDKKLARFNELNQEENADREAKGLEPLEYTYKEYLAGIHKIENYYFGKKKNVDWFTAHYIPEQFRGEKAEKAAKALANGGHHHENASGWPYHTETAYGPATDPGDFRVLNQTPYVSLEAAPEAAEPEAQPESHNAEPEAHHGDDHHAAAPEPEPDPEPAAHEVPIVGLAARGTTSIAAPAPPPTRIDTTYLDRGVTPGLVPFGTAVGSNQALTDNPKDHYTWETLPVAERDRMHLFFQIYYMMTGLHGLHVLIGMGLIGWIAVRAALGQFTPEYNAPVDIVGLYWHLVDLIWIFLFPLLYLIH
ncbi:MAG: cytochrome c oxidase subunit 3 [Planctomycetota bacterium]